MHADSYLSVIAVILLALATVAVMIGIAIALYRGRGGRAVVGMLVVALFVFLLLPGIAWLRARSHVTYRPSPVVNTYPINVEQQGNPFAGTVELQMPDGETRVVNHDLASHSSQPEHRLAIASRLLLFAMVVILIALLASGVVWIMRGRTALGLAAMGMGAGLIVGALCFSFASVESHRPELVHVVDQDQAYPAPDPFGMVPAQASTNEIEVPLASAADAAPSPAAAPPAAAPPSGEKLVEVVAEGAANSVLPVGASLTSAPRPAWVDARPARKQGSYPFVLSVGPYKTREECDHELTNQLQQALRGYANTYVRRGAGDHVGIAPMALESATVKEVYEDIIHSSFGPMLQLYANCEFTESLRQQLIQQDNAVLHQQRVTKLALGCGLVLGIMSIVFGYLKLDTATRGYYSGRLQVGAGLAILVLGTAGAAAYVHLSPTVSSNWLGRISTIHDRRVPSSTGGEHVIDGRRVSPTEKATEY